MEIRYVREPKVTMRDSQGKRLASLLWGDTVRLLEQTGETAHVLSRGWEGYIPLTSLGDQDLLELYIIDVGQGDGLLMKIPGAGWTMIDAGIAGKDQMTGKGAANFVRWKFIKDLGLSTVDLENVILSHPDYDHFGGLMDILSGKLADGRSFPVRVQNYYHNGIGRYKSAPKNGAVESGEVAPYPQGSKGLRRKSKFITELLSDRHSFNEPSHPFAAEFSELAKLVGSVPEHVQRLSHLNGYLPGYAPGEKTATIKVLGPIEESFGTQRGLRQFSGEAPTVNGHSVVLRVDFGAVRILLTGDLNADSQRLLLSYQPAQEFSADIAKACHHGAEDVDLDFIKAVEARATVISSGDNENYAHPRPVLMGASARYGREAKDPEGGLMAPLLYSTELSRSIKLAYAQRLLVDKDRKRDTPPERFWPEQTWLVGGADVIRRADRAPFAADLVYGLVNVRTDGRRVLCATMEEKGNEFDLKTFEV